MRLYLASSDLAFSLLQLAPDCAWPWRGGVPVRDDWTTPELRLADAGMEQFIPVDCFTMNTGSDGLILSSFARQALMSRLEVCGEFWPVRIYGHTYWWFNCLAAKAALDRDATQADWSEVAGPWGAFRWITSTRRLAFCADRLAEAPLIFRIPEYPQGALFSGDELRERVGEDRLTGFRFDLVWSLDRGGVIDPPGISVASTLRAESEADVAERRALARAVLVQRARDFGRQ